MSIATVFDLENLSAAFRPPVLIVSTLVGRGMYTLGEAIRQRYRPGDAVEHVGIEDYLPSGAVTEDVRRYKLIADKLPFLLYLIYKIPIFYYRKYLRERYGRGTDLGALKARIEALKPRTVICVSHRPAFWVSNLKRRERMDFDLVGVLGEYGNTLGWRYIFWDQVDGFLSPVERRQLSYRFPERLRFENIELPARREYYGVAGRRADAGSALMVCGYWGQGPILKIVRTLLDEAPDLRVTVVCGENAAACERVRAAFADNHKVAVHGVVPSLLPFLAECSCVVTKPGISTLLEAHAARQKIFLLKGMPVAEDNNARYAVRHFGAEWFSRESFRSWRRGLAA